MTHPDHKKTEWRLGFQNIDVFAGSQTIQSQNNYEGSYGLVQNLTIENKEIMEKLLKSKDDQINLLQNVINKFFK